MFEPVFPFEFFVYAFHFDLLIVVFMFVANNGSKIGPEKPQPEAVIGKQRRKCR